MGVGTALARPVAPPGGFLRALGDERLVARVRGGDDRAFEAIYDRHYRGLLSFCRHMLGSREEAEDALQHSFAAAYRSLRASDSPIQLRAWLYAIARNQCLSILRTRREHVPIDDIARATDGLAAEVEHRGELRELLGDLQRLPHEQRAALVLAELGAHSHEDIAVILGVRKDKVKALVFQARESLATSRQARDTPCREIQEQLSVLRGGALRRGPIRRHLHACPACQAFRAEVARQRAAMAVLLPVAPSLALKSAVLGPLVGGAAGTAAAGAGAGAVGGLTGSAAGAGGGLSLAGKGLAAKALVATALAGGIGGGTVVVEELHHHHRTGPTHPVHRTARPAPATPVVGGGAQGVASGAPAVTAAPPARSGLAAGRAGHGDKRRRITKATDGTTVAGPGGPASGAPATAPPPAAAVDPSGTPGGSDEQRQAGQGRRDEAHQDEKARKREEREAELARKREGREAKRTGGQQGRPGAQSGAKQAGEAGKAGRGQGDQAQQQGSAGQKAGGGKQQAEKAGRKQARQAEQAPKQQPREAEQARVAEQPRQAEQAVKHQPRGGGDAFEGRGSGAQPQDAGGNGDDGDGKGSSEKKAPGKGHH